MARTRNRQESKNDIFIGTNDSLIIYYLVWHEASKSTSPSADFGLQKKGANQLRQQDLVDGEQIRRCVIVKRVLMDS